MAASSSMLELGTSLPSFSLPDTTSHVVISSDSLRGSIGVVAFLCNHCPYVKHIQRGFSEFAREYGVFGPADYCVARLRELVEIGRASCRERV